MATVDVIKLSYEPTAGGFSALFASTWDFVKSRYLKMRATRISSTLNSVSFTAKAGEITAVISNQMAERRTLSQLIANRRGFGNFDGQICISGKSKIEGEPIKSCFLSREAKKLYTPGLSYEAMVYYSARLRMPFENKDFISKRVDDILVLMDLHAYRKRIIPNVPNMRGTLGGELRRLSIAVEIVALPEIIILDDPTRNLDPAIANQIFERLKVLADNGHTVICSIPKPSLQMMEFIDAVVLMYRGYSVFASHKNNVVPYFKSVHYNITETTNIPQFLIDVTEGSERSIEKRDKGFPDPAELHLAFEKSEFATKMDRTTQYKTVLPDTGVKYYGYFQGDGFLAGLKRSFIVLERAYWVKLGESEIIQRGWMSNIVVACFMGYLAFGTGSFGEYTKALFLPYNKTLNTVALLFIVTAYVVVQQIANVHTICQKMRVFRYEQKAGCCPMFAMWIATVTSEATFAMLFATVFSTVFFFMLKLNDLDQMGFYTSVIAMTSVVGCGISTSMAAVFRAEIVVRDLFVFYLFANIMLSGFPFLLPSMTDEAMSLSTIDPMRWTFESLMVWKFADYPDGISFLTTYAHQNFDKDSIYRILLNFLIFFYSVFFITLIPAPNTLTRKLRELSGAEIRLQKQQRASLEATDFDDEDISDEALADIHRKKTPVKPLLFSRETSVSGIPSELSSANSALGLTDHRNNIGPKIVFKDLNYLVKDKDAPLGYRSVLSKVNGVFENSKLNVIMGASGSGRSTLLSVLGGNPIAGDAQMTGSIKLNEFEYDKTVKPWQRCAYVDAVDYHYRDISVRESLTYGAILRCSTTLGLSMVERNVDMTLNLMQLTDDAEKKTKKLTAGGRRRLSIAEEVVHGLPLLFVDEPVTNVGDLETAIIMKTLREMVNQQRTVVITAHQPSQEVFQLFDTMVLLSKGCVIFSGNASEVLTYFKNLSAFKFDKTLSLYVNPADFLTDVSACVLRNADGEILDTPTLEAFFKSSSYCQVEQTYFSERTSFDRDNVVVSDNPLFKGKNRAGNPPPPPPKKISRMSLEATRPSVYSTENESGFKPFNIETCLLSVFMFCYGTMYEIIWLNPVLFRSRIWLLLVRSFKVLFKREKLVIGAIAVHMLIAFTFSFIAGDLSEETGNVLSMYGIGSMLLIIANIQFGFFIFKNNQVFMKEHSRGLYSVFLYWLFASVPFLSFRFLLGLMYGLMNTGLGKLDDDTAGFYLQITMMMVLAASTIGESIISLSPDKDRTFYAMIPGVGFILFFLSGLMIKADTLPVWTRPFLPSVSIIRWAMQGMTINRFQDSDLFPTIGNYSTYQALIHSFGWGGKTKFYCQNMVLLNMVIFRVLTYLALFYRSRTQVGRRTLLKEEDDVHQY